jgi:hypothetical protein
MKARLAVPASFLVLVAIVLTTREIVAQPKAAQSPSTVVIESSSRHAPVSEPEQKVVPLTQVRKLGSAADDVVSKGTAVGDPVAVPDAYATNQNATLTITAPGLIANDIDLEGDAIIAANFYAPLNGTLTSIVTSGAFTYVPDVDFVGRDTFRYRIRDIDENFSPYVEVIIDVMPDPDRPPLVVQDHYATFLSTTLVEAAPGLIENDVDPDGDAITAANFFSPSHGTLTSIVTSGAFTYEPEIAYVGADTFSYRIRDPANHFSEYDSVFIDILAPGGDTPLVVEDAYATFQDRELTVAAPGLLHNDVDPNGDTIIATNFFSPSHGTLTSIVTSGAFTYVPDPGFVGTDLFTYRIRDTDDNFSEYDTVTIEVLPEPNRPPVVVQDYYATPINTTLSVPAPGLIGNDYDADGESIIAANYFSPTYGTLTSIVTNGSFVYEPPPGFTGVDFFSYRIRDTEDNFSEYDSVAIVVTDGTPLPVELVAFRAVGNGRDVILSWTTASELNNAGFEVQHLEDDVFAELGFIEGAGTTTRVQEYTFVVRGLEPGTQVFRLKQIDYDGGFEYSANVETLVEIPGGFYLSQPFPNPFSLTTSVTLAVARRQVVNVDVFDVLGRRVVRLLESQLDANDRHMVRFRGEGLGGGQYVIRASGDSVTKSRLVTLVR